MTLFSSYRLIFLILLVGGVLSFIRGVLFIDPDFGWHLRMGEIISHSGIPSNDPFSYTMPEFSYIDHEWLTDLMIYKIYSLFGIWGLSFIFSVIFLASLLLSIPNKYKDSSVVPLLIGSSVILPFSGIRPQIITWFFTSIILFMFFNKKYWDRFRFFVPLIFLLWVNLHGGFALGLFVFLLILIVSIIKSKSVEYKDLAILVASFIVTIANPYGLNIWREILSSALDSELRHRVGEWMSPLSQLDIGFPIFFSVSILFIIRAIHKIDFRQVIVYVFLLILSLSSQRHIPIWILSAIAPSAQGLFEFSSEAKKNKVSSIRYEKVKKILAFVLFVFFIFKGWETISNSIDFSEENFYPGEAISYLKSQEVKGEVFSDYNWGGYLIWKYPEKKVFIDGRMPSWRDGDKSAIEELSSFHSGRVSFDELSNKYQIEYVLLPNPQSRINKPSVLSKYLKKYFGIESEKRDFVQEIEESGVKKVYNDEKSVIYKRQL